jgi:type IV pilus assembly protein PilB
MSRPRFGEVLSRLVSLSPHDVSEILVDQSATRRRFGEIALAFGLCKPHHVWRAWWSQLSDAPERVDLDAIGIDVQCLAHLPRALAVDYNVIPLRACGSQMVIAAAEGGLMRAMEELPRRMKIQLKFVLADGAQVQKAINAYYHSDHACKQQERTEAREAQAVA